ncbi:RNA polymerase I enhancer binding protein [Arthrobotrys musiformis]|uniref:RNA polymerase I enhancer binding protein n=1 Tax=Arthrobotrys musiformis TaxID=47236 RepID=A0AAV9VPN3_9PEZI
MLRNFWSFVASTPQKSSQSETNLEEDIEASPTPIVEPSEEQSIMPSSPDHEGTPVRDGTEEISSQSPNTKRKKHKKKIKSSPVSVVEVPATAEQLEDQAEEDEEDAAMADVSNAEAGAKRKRRKSDLELSEKKAKRPRRNKKGAEGGEQVVVNGSLPAGEAGDENEDERNGRPYIPGVRWFGDVPGVFHEGSWVEADLSEIEAIKARIKAKKVLPTEQQEPEMEEQEPETVVEETDREDTAAQNNGKQKRKQNRKTKKDREPTPEVDNENHQQEVEAEREPANIDGEEEAETDGNATKKQKKGKGNKSRKQPETEVEDGPQSEPSTKERKRRRASKDAPEDSNRRRTYPRDTEELNPPPVIIPTPTDGSHGNSKGVGPPPRPEAYDKGPYTPMEDALIQNVVNRYCQIQIPRLNRAGFLEILWNNERHKTDFWNILMTNLPLRSRSSLHNHVKRMYHSFEDRGKWTQEQDNELRDLVAAKGPKWSFIGNVVHRMPEDCRDRWKNYLVCGEKRRTHGWDEDEIEKLRGIMDDVLTTIVEGHEEEGTLILEVPEGENEQERASRLEKEKILHRQEIDWTIVSDRMDHTRSRMQCRAKGLTFWGKAGDEESGSIADDLEGKTPRKRGPKRGRKKKQAAEEEDEAEEIPSPAIDEAKNMLPGDYLFVLQRISIQGYDCLASIDWNKLSEVDPVKHFTPEQFKAGFHAYMKRDNPQKKDLRTFVADQLGDLSELPGMIRNKRYRPPVGASSPAVARPRTAEKDKGKGRQKKQQEKQVQQPGLSVEIQTGASRASSQLSSTPRRLARTEKPSHSPGNPFAKQPGGDNEAASPSASRKKGKATPAKASKASKASPKKDYKSAEYITDSEENENNGNERPEEEGNTMEVDGENDLSGDAEAQRPEAGSEADDEMGESVAFGNASKDKRR